MLSAEAALIIQELQAIFTSGSYSLICANISET
jgi:hypothetical protein